MQSTHGRGLVILVICWSACACGATERNPGGTAAGGGQTLGPHSSAGVSGSGGADSETLSAADAMALFAQAPHCTTDSSTSYLLEGSIDGGMVKDAPDGFSGGFENGNTGHFTSPGFGGSTDPTRVSIDFEWKHSLAYGQASLISQGTVIPPAGHPRAGEEICITRGVVGFPSGGPEDGYFKFWLRGARLGPDCSGDEVPIEVRGCMN